MVTDAAVTIPQTKQQAYRHSSSSSSPVNAIVQRPGSCLDTEGAKPATTTQRASGEVFQNKTNKRRTGGRD